MSYLINEILLRLAKLLAAAIVGVILYALAIGPFGATPSVELGLLCWISASAGLLLLESSPL